MGIYLETINASEEAEGITFTMVNVMEMPSIHGWFAE